MSRLLTVTLLLIILAELYCSTAFHVHFQVSNVHIRKCRCQVMSKGRTRCPVSSRKPMMPHELQKCFCSKANQHKFPEFRAACNSMNVVMSTPL